MFYSNKLNVIGNIATIHIVLTNFCNQGCKGCYQENLTDTKSILTLNENIKHDIVKLFIQYKEQFQQVKLSFFGGEPLTRIDTIIEIIEDLYSKNLIPDYIHIPTSGGKNQNLIKNPKLTKLLELKDKFHFKNTKFTLSQSYDGPSNLEFRNVDPKDIMESLKITENISSKIDDMSRPNIFKPEFNMNLIPQVIDENYFIDTQKDILEVTGLYPTFRIPHLLNPNSNLDTEVLVKAIRIYFRSILCPSFIHENSPGYRKKLLINLYQKKHLPKLFYDIVSQICDPKDYRFLWCQAGTNHKAITFNGLHPNGCEYLKVPALDLHDLMEKKCFGCEIQTWCPRPCLKSFEQEHLHQLERQCTIRKIIFNEIKNILIGTNELQITN